MPTPAPRRLLQNKAFVVLLVGVSLAFAWVVSPFYEAVLWSTVLGVVFGPLYRRAVPRLGGRRTVAAVCTVLVILMLVILPAIVITSMLLEEALGLYKRIESGEFSPGGYLRQVLEALPPFMIDILDRFGITTMDDIVQRATAGLQQSLQFLASRAVTVGQGTVNAIVSFFLMVYILFYVIRDGGKLAARIRRAIPLEESLQREVGGKFIEVVRAIMKGTVVVAIVQGVLGGIMFAILGIPGAVFWGVVMAFLSLLPILGTAMVWLPVALYFLITGAYWQGIALIAFGSLVIGLVDNVLRPILVGKDTQIPDYVVLIVTLGGMAIFGFHGFVIGPIVAALFIAVWGIVARAQE